MVFSGLNFMDRIERERELIAMLYVYIYPTKKKRIQLLFLIFLKLTINSVILFILFFSVLIEQYIV